MGSISISICRRLYPGKSDVEIATAIAQRDGDVAVLRYKSDEDSDYTDFAFCRTDEEVQSYFSSPHCKAIEVLYDIRSQVLVVTPEFVLRAQCIRCGRRASADSLNPLSENQFYFCPVCAGTYCGQCYPYLPLTGSPGFAKCRRCDVQLQRARPGIHGAKPLSEAGREAVRELGKTKSSEPRVIDALISALGDSDQQVVWHAADKLGESGDKSAVAPLIEVLHKGGKLARAHAAQALGALEDASAVEPLIETLLTDEYWAARRRAAQALGRISDGRAIDALIRALEDKQKEVRLEAVEALGNFKHVRITEALTKALQAEQSAYAREKIQSVLERITKS